MSARAGQLTFSVDSLLLGELGERLVSKNHIALAELIKNAYDADATNVKVVLQKTRTASKKSRIAIIDNGHGMTFHEIQLFWMRVATPGKLREPFSPRYGRRETGNKGIGRFACRRLARKLVIESTAKSRQSGKMEFTRVVFNWDKFKPGLTLTLIPSVYRTRTISDGPSGLTINLVGLRERWTPRDFDVLRRQVLGLSIVKGMKREKYEEDPGFEIIFDAPEFETRTVSISEQTMDAGWGRLRGSVEKNGAAVLELDYLESYEEMKTRNAKFELPAAFVEIPGASFDIAMIWRNKDHCRDRSILTLGLIDEIFNDWSGVRVYLDGFRVYPYGDPGDDWLSIDRDVARRLASTSDIFRRVSQSLLGVKHTRAMLNHPMSKNLLGRVILSNQPVSVFDVMMNREGFVEDEAFGQLKRFIRQGLEWATLYYSHFLFKLEEERVKREANELKGAIAELEERPEKTMESTQAAIPIVESALDLMENLVKIATQEPQIESAGKTYEHAKQARRVVEATISRLEAQTNTLRTIASTGGLMVVFVHEARTVVARLDTHAGRLETLAQTARNERQELLKLAEELRATSDRLGKQLKLITNVSKDLADFTRRRVSLKKVFEEVKDCFEGLKEREHFEIHAKIPDTLKTGPMLEQEVYSVMVNLLSNAVKSVIASDRGHRIEVEAIREKEGTVLRVYDEGIGFAEEYKERLGMPFVADPDGRLYKRLREKLEYGDFLVVGEGSGLGLSIVKDIVGYYGKTLRIIDVEKPWKACVEVTLP